VAWGLPASRAAASSTACTSAASRRPPATSWPRLKAARFRVALRRPARAAATAARSPARAARPYPPPRPAGVGLGGGWSAQPPVGPAAGAARPGPRAASSSAAEPSGRGGRWRAGRVGPRSTRPGPASLRPAAAGPGCPARSGRTADANLPRRCAPPAPDAPREQSMQVPHSHEPCSSDALSGWPDGGHRTQSLLPAEQRRVWLGVGLGGAGRPG
jgi:hypothetical protein